jgi:hypothetical protein
MLQDVSVASPFRQCCRPSAFVAASAIPSRAAQSPHLTAPACHITAVATFKLSAGPCYNLETAMPGTGQQARAVTARYAAMEPMAQTAWDEDARTTLASAKRTARDSGGMAAVPRAGSRSVLGPDAPVPRDRQGTRANAPISPDGANGPDAVVTPPRCGACPKNPLACPTQG